MTAVEEVLEVDRAARVIASEIAGKLTRARLGVTQ